MSWGWFVIAGLLAMLAGGFAWLWWITRSAPFGTETRKGLRIHSAPMPDDRSSIRQHKRIMSRE